VIKHRSCASGQSSIFVVCNMVDSFGKCFHNKDITGFEGDTRLQPNLYELKLQTISQYFFYLAFENSNMLDYVTEKIFHCYLARTLPVYMGAPNIDNFVPFPHSYINTRDFKSPQELASFLLKVAEDEKLYLSYFGWNNATKLSKGFEDLFNHCRATAFCRLCKKAYQLLRRNKVNNNT